MNLEPGTTLVKSKELVDYRYRYYNRRLGDLEIKEADQELFSGLSTSSG
jgi:hypothetical protein